MTGANAGVGRHTARGLARLGFRVILGVRSETRGKEAADWIKASSKAAHRLSATVDVFQLDLSDFDSVCSFSQRVSARWSSIDVLVLNAGIGGMNAVPEATSDGAADDLTFRTNFVGHFLLLRKLEPLLRSASPPARVVCLSSVMHRSGNTNWSSALRFKAGRSTYSTSKLAMAVLAAEVCRRWELKGVAVNPGAVNSEIWYRGQLSGWQESFVKPTFRALFLTSEQGAATSLAAATDPAFATAEAGVYLSPYRSPQTTPMPFDLYGPFAGARRCMPHPSVRDTCAGTELWRVASEHLRSFLDVDGQQEEPS